MKGNNKMTKTSNWVLLKPAQVFLRQKRRRPMVCSSDLAFRLEITCDTITRDLWLVIAQHLQQQNRSKTIGNY
jgi:hypothetical protein